MKEIENHHGYENYPFEDSKYVRFYITSKGNIIAFSGIFIKKYKDFLKMFL